MELFSINKASLVWVSSGSNTGSIRDDPYWTSRKTSLELIELSTMWDATIRFFGLDFLAITSRDS